MSLLKKSLVSPDQEVASPEPSPTNDRRFNDPAWDQWPYNLFRSSFLIQSKWWEQATQGVWGVDPQHERLLAFGAKQWLEMVSPTNSALFNPVVLKKTIEEQGANLARGMLNQTGNRGGGVVKVQQIPQWEPRAVQAGESA